MKRAFTLIELLIVVAIIAILAAIAVPNFLEAQVRAKVSRGQADMRSLATAIETYRMDHRAYPAIIAPNSPTAGFTGGGGSGINGPSQFMPGAPGVSSRFVWLTTPVSYMSSIPRDPFVAGWAMAADGTSLEGNGYDGYDYTEAKSVSPGGALGGTRGYGITSGGDWHVVGCGPDRRNAFGGAQIGAGALVNQMGCDYDPTNGTMSYGDVVRVGGGPGRDFGTKPAWDRIRRQKNF